MLVSTRKSRKLLKTKKYKRYHYEKDGNDIEECHIIMSNPKLVENVTNVSPSIEDILSIQEQEDNDLSLLSIVKKDHSIKCYSENIKQFLLSSNSNINQQDEDGNTSLHYIVNTRCMNCFNSIINFPGISVLISNNKGETVLDKI
jgi:ankyrin repeat protein